MPARKAVLGIVFADPSVRRALERLVKSMGLSAKSFSSIDQLSSIEGTPPDCLIVDVPLSDSLLERAHPCSKEPPMIVLTVMGDRTARKKALEAGAVEVVEKPFDDSELIGALRKALARNAGRSGEPMDLV